MKYSHGYLWALLLLLLAAMTSPHAEERYVAPDGKDDAQGIQSAPFRTIQHAFNQSSAGDVIVLRGGTYRESVSLKDKSGREGAPITLTAYQGEKPVISGLDVLTLPWEATPQKGIFVATLDTHSVLQLFCNGKPMLEARWPNVPRDANGDWNFFTPSVWASADTDGNAYGTLASTELAKTKWDVTGANAVLNVDHQFYCWTRQVLTHSAGSKAFTYNQDLGKSVDRHDETGVGGKWNLRNKFYLFGLKQFLDEPGEWYYDAAAKKLYVCSPDGKSPADSIVEIKTREWGFSADQTSSHLTIDGIGFFATAFRFGKDGTHRSSHIVFRNNSVLHSSWSEYLSLKVEEDENGGDSVYPTMQSDNSQVVNNTFAYGALSGLSINGFDNVIENNLFHDFDYSSSLIYPPLQISKPSKALDGKAGRAAIRCNTIYRSGGIQVRVAQAGNDFSLNDVHDSFLAAFGGNKDTSAVYTMSPSCSGTRFHHNWVHGGYSGTPPLPWGGGMGIRGDDNTCGLTVDHNVVWDSGSVGIFIKNVETPTPDQANSCVNNTVYNHSSYNPTKSAIIVASLANKSKKKKEAASEGANGQMGENPNAFSTVANNLSDSIYGQWNAKPMGKVKLFTNNAKSLNAAADVVNATWHDFRPSASATAVINKGIAVEGISPMVAGKAPDLGAYQRGEKEYWIPGQRLASASFPIVPDKAQSVAADRDVLMWRPAYGATSHTVTFSTTKDGLNQTKSPTIQKAFQGDENVFSLPHLRSGTTYFWRVDAVMPDKSVSKGEIWTFSTK